MSNRLRRVGVSLLAAIALVATLSAPASAGQNGALCTSNTARVAIPDKFPLDACFDGSKLHVVNTLEFPVIVSVTGNGVGGSERAPKLGGAMPSAILSLVGRDIPNLVPPGYQIRVPIGAGEAKVQLSSTPDLTKGYAIIAIVWKYSPGLSASKNLADMISELAQVGDQYLQCMQSNNNWGDIGCRALLVRNVTFAVGRAGLTAAKGIAGAMMAMIDSALWSNQVAQDVAKARGGVSSFTIGAAPAPKPADPPAKVVQPPAGTPSKPQPPATGGHVPPPPPPPPTTRQIVVQNKYLVGGSGMTEDSVPAYLSSQMQPRCRLNGCMLPNTNMGSGDVLTVSCYAFGAAMTNQNVNRPDDDNNPNRVDSSLWYWGTRNGQTGYISEVYIEARYRGGLGLPGC